MAEMFALCLDDKSAGGHVAAAAYATKSISNVPRVYITKNGGCDRSDDETAKTIQAWVRVSALLPASVVCSNDPTDFAGIGAIAGKISKDDVARVADATAEDFCSIFIDSSDTLT
jgi:hypothetical protein